MKTAHLTLVMIFEDILLCSVGVLLGDSVSEQNLSGTVNKVSMAITLSCCSSQYIIAFHNTLSCRSSQYIMAFHKSCVYFKGLDIGLQPGGNNKCPKPNMQCCGIWLFVLLATGALSLACTKAIYVFNDTNEENDSHERHSPYINILGSFVSLLIISVMILCSIKWCCLFMNRKNCLQIRQIP